MADELTPEEVQALMGQVNKDFPDDTPSFSQPIETAGAGRLDKIMGGVHQAMAPFSGPRGLSDIASQGVLGVMNNTGMIPNAPPGSRGAQLSDTKTNPVQPTIGGQLGAMGSEAMGVLKGGVPGFAGPPGASSGGGGRLIAATFRNPQINPGIATMAAGVDEIAAYLKRASDEFQKKGEPDKARYAEAARQMLVNGETTAEDVISDPLLFSGALKSVLGKGVEAAGSVFGQAIPGLKTAGNLVGKYAHAVGLPGLAAQGAEAGSRAIGGGIGALEGGDPAVAGQGMLDFGTQAALASQSSPKDYVTSMTTKKSPLLDVDERIAKVTAKPDLEKMQAFNDSLAKIPGVAGHTKILNKASAYTSTGFIQKLFGKSGVDPAATKRVVDAIIESKKPNDSVSSNDLVAKLEKEGSPLTHVDVVNVLELLQKNRFLSPLSVDRSKGPGEGSFLIRHHGEWQKLIPALAEAVKPPTNATEHYMETGQPLPVDVEIPGKTPDQTPTPAPLAPLTPDEQASTMKRSQANEFTPTLDEPPLGKPTLAPLPRGKDFVKTQKKLAAAPAVEPPLPPPPSAPPPSSSGTPPPPPPLPPTAPPAATSGVPPLPPPPVKGGAAPPTPPAPVVPPQAAVPPVAEQASSVELPPGAKPLPPPPTKKLAKSDSWIAENPKVVEKLLKLDRASAANIKEFQGLDKTLVRHILDRVFKKKGGDEPPPEGGVPPLPPPPVPPTTPGQAEEGSGPKGPNVLGMATSYGPSGASNTWIKNSKARIGDVDTSGEYMGRTQEWFAPTRLEDVIKRLVAEGDITLPEGITPRNLADAVIERHGPKAITQQNATISKGLEVEGEERYKYWAQDEINSMKVFGQIVETLKNWGKPLAKNQPIEPTDTSPVEETPTTGIRPYTGPRFTPRQAAKVTQKQANSPERAAFLEEQKAASDKRAAEEKYQAERKARLEEANKKDAEELRKRELEAKIKAGREAKAAQPKGRPSVGRKPDSISPEELIIASASGVPGTQKGRPTVNVPKPTPWEAPLVEDVTGAVTPPLPKSLPEPPVQKQFPDQFDYPIRKGPTPGTKTDVISGRTWRPSTSEPVKKNSQEKVTLEGEKVPGIMTSISPGPEPQRVWKKGISEEARLTKVGEAQKDPHSLEVKPGHVDAAKAIFAGNKQIQEQLAAAKGKTLGEVMASIMEANKKAGRSNKDLTNRIAPVLAGLSKRANVSSERAAKIEGLTKELPRPPGKYDHLTMEQIRELLDKNMDEQPDLEIPDDLQKEYALRKRIEWHLDQAKDAGDVGLQDLSKIGHEISNSPEIRKLQDLCDKRSAEVEKLEKDLRIGGKDIYDTAKGRAAEARLEVAIATLERKIKEIVAAKLKE